MKHSGGLYDAGGECACIWMFLFGEGCVEKSAVSWDRYSSYSTVS